MSDTHFTHTQDQLKQLARDVLAYAKAHGGTDCAVEISEGSGLSVSVRKSQVETIEQNRDKGMGVTVFIGQRRGNASTSDFSPAALKATVEAAYNIARFTADDDCAGLADEALLERAPRDLKLFYPWQISADEAVALKRSLNTPPEDSLAVAVAWLRSTLRLTRPASARLLKLVTAPPLRK